MQKGLLLFFMMGMTGISAQNFETAFEYPYPKRMVFLDSIYSSELKPYRRDSIKFHNSVQELKNIAIEKKDNKAVLYADYLLFFYSLYNASVNEQEALDKLKELEARAKKLKHYFVQIQLYTNMGYYYYHYSAYTNYILYFDYLYKAYLLYKDLDLKEYPSKTYDLYSLGLAHYKFGDYKDAKKYALEANTLAPTGHIKIFNDNLLGVTYLKLHQFDSARFYLQRTFLQATESNKAGELKGWTGIALGNIGHTWREEKQYDRAIIYYEEAVEICMKYKLWDNASGFASHLISIYVIKGQLKKAEEMMPIAREATYKYNNMEGYYLYYDALANYYKANKSGMEAILYRDSAIYWNDSLHKTFDRNLKVQIQLANYQELAADKEALFLLEKSRQRIIRNSIILFVVLALIIAWFIFRSQKKTLKNRTILLKEIHHRVKNNLQIISSILDIQQRGLNNPDLKEAFKDAKSRINSMALVHQSLYEKDNMESTDAQKYFEQLLKVITASYAPKNKKITYELLASDIRLNIDTLIPIALIFNELLTNSYKYAFQEKESGHIHFELTKKDDMFSMIFKDDGKGLPAGFDLKNSTGLGSLMIQQLTQQLFGKFTVKSSLEGTEFYFNFKGL